jgi:hypothetical protein
MIDIWAEMANDFTIQRALDDLDRQTPDISARVIDPGYGTFIHATAPRWAPTCDGCQFVGRYDPIKPLTLGFTDGHVIAPESFDLWYHSANTTSIVITWGPLTGAHRTVGLRGSSDNMLYCPVADLQLGFPVFHPMQIAMQAVEELHLGETE